MSAFIKFSSFFICVFLMALSCTPKKIPVQYNSEFQKKMNEQFKDASSSPLKPKDLKEFTSLSFFPIDSVFVVKAKLTSTPDSDYFDMKTNTALVTKERIYGVLSFKLLSQYVELNVYQGIDSIASNPNYLFLPFLDDTNGNTTYGGGRYMDLAIPKGDSLWLDFNTAYNPYCEYNELYSCPIVPRQNYIPIEVRAGLKRFK
ncbi:MAG: DUF1684 domain-containing protein [Bacteroidetes bacterium]|nr:DUF1684 domain-containing protein [Bacteroidota bacterium]